MSKEKIVFTLNNTGIHYDYCNMTFSSFEMLLTNPASDIHNFIACNGYFNEAAFQLLNNRLKDNFNIRVPMNEKHLIIFYSVVHYVCKALVDEKEEAILRSLLEKQDDFIIVRDKILGFGSVVTEKLRRENKRLKLFSAAAEKISGY